LSIYGDGVTRSPHFLSSPMTLIELWRLYPGIIGPHDIAALMRSGQLVYDEALGKCVEPVTKASDLVAPVKKVAKKRSKKR
jgi:hypothetical protein